MREIQDGELPQPGSTHTWSWPQDGGPESFTMLYAKAQAGQWSAQDLPWDEGASLKEAAVLPEQVVPFYGTPLWESMTPEQQRHLCERMMVYQLSGLLHGERAGLIGPAETAMAIAWGDAKKCACIMAADEARHTDVLERYMAEKAPDDDIAPISGPVSSVLQFALDHQRPEFRHLVAGCVAEGLALGLYGGIAVIADDPLLNAILKSIVQDEARHVAFAVLLTEALQDEWSQTEREAAEDTVLDAVIRMNQRGADPKLYIEVGLDPEEVDAVIASRTSDEERQKQRAQFYYGHVMPNLKRLGMVTPRTESKYRELGLVE